MPSPKLRPSDRSYSHPEPTEGYTGTWEQPTPAEPTATPAPRLEPPDKIGQWTIQETIAALSRRLPDSIMSTKSQGRSKIPFITWYAVNAILDKYSPGWCWEMRSVQFTADRVFVVGRLSLQTSEGIVYREATGSEELKATTRDGEIKEIAYGDPSSNAESMAFRRCAARFGLGLYLYDK